MTKTTSRKNIAKKENQNASPPTKTKGQNCKKSTRSTSKRRPGGEVQRLITAIRNLQKLEADNRVALISCRIEIGEKLQALKGQVEQGDWTVTIEQLGYNERQAQRLMQIASSDWADEIRTKGTDLGQHLPCDLQKLASLASLSLEQFQELLGKEDINDLTRAKVAEHIRGLNERVKRNDADVNTSSGDAIPSDHNGVTNTYEDDTVGEGGSHETLDLPHTGESTLNNKSHVLDHQHRIQQFHQIVSGKPRAENRPVKKAIERVFGRFESEVLKTARRYGKEACNSAVRLAKFDDVTLGMILLQQLQDRLDPEHAFDEKPPKTPVSKSEETT